MSLTTSFSLLIFSRYPTPGEAKTRLIPALGTEGAAQLHQQMTEAAIATAQATDLFNPKNGRNITVHFTGAELKKFQTWLGPELQYLAQPLGGDLGQRMASAFNTAFTLGRKHVIGIGTDVPELTSEILDQADQELDHHDIVLGPAADGGYYLLGMSSFTSELFANIDWGTEHVYTQTVAICTQLGLKISALQTLNDVDRPEDLIQLRDDPRFVTFFSNY